MSAKRELTLVNTIELKVGIKKKALCANINEDAMHYRMRTYEKPVKQHKKTYNTQVFFHRIHVIHSSHSVVPGIGGGDG